MSGQPLIKVAVLDDYQNVALAMADWSVLEGRVEVTVFNDHLVDPDAVIARLLPFEVVCVMRERTPLPRAILEQLGHLRLIVSTGPRNASIDLEAARQRGITVCNTGYSSHGAMEMTWALILSAIRSVPTEAASVRNGGWQVAIGGDLRGKTLGIVGLGTIGSAIAHVAQAFQMETLAWSQNLTRRHAEQAGARLVGKEELFRLSDVVTLHLVLSSRTRGIVGAPELSLMKPSAWLINTSRGPLIQEAALVDVLQKCRIAGAALDVYDDEPLPPDHPFRALDNVVATPHVGFVTRDTYKTFYSDTVENIAAWLDGHPLRVA
jgi:phosphoglycerate dehydrogenase-like enzyme